MRLNARPDPFHISVRNPDDLAGFERAGLECLVLDYSDSACIEHAVEQCVVLVTQYLIKALKN